MARPVKNPANNYFTRKKFKLEPEVAVWLEEQTGYRAAWMMFGEKPRRVSALRDDLEAVYCAGRVEAVEEAITRLRAILGASTLAVDASAAGTEAAESVPPEVPTTIREAEPLKEAR